MFNLRWWSACNSVQFSIWHLIVYLSYVWFFTHGSFAFQGTFTDEKSKASHHVYPYPSSQEDGKLVFGYELRNYISLDFKSISSGLNNIASFLKIRLLSIK